MKAKEYIEHIVESRNNEDMEALEQVFYESLRYIQDNSVEMFKNISTKLYIIAYGEQLDEDSAIEEVEEMKPCGEHWDMNTTTQVAKQHGITFKDFSECSFYWTMNMLYNDYSKVLDDDVEIYINMAKAFLVDEDAPTGDVKVFRYIHAMK